MNEKDESILVFAGNVREWCHDWYDPHFYDRAPRRDPVNDEPRADNWRVTRGGSWAYPPTAVSHRASIQNVPIDDVGFRVVFPRSY